MPFCLLPRSGAKTNMDMNVEIKAFEAYKNGFLTSSDMVERIAEDYPNVSAELVRVDKKPELLELRVEFENRLRELYFADEQLMTAIDDAIISDELNRQE